MGYIYIYIYIFESDYTKRKNHEGNHDINFKVNIPFLWNTKR